MRVVHALALLTTLIATATPGLAQDPECAAQAPDDFSNIDWQRPERLVGRYDVVLVDSVRPRKTSLYRSLRLVLSVPDSALRGTFPPISLVATVETLESRQESLAWQRPWPRSGLSGRTLVLEMLGVADGIGEALYPDRLTADGFRGTWVHSSGLAMVVVGEDGTVYPPAPEPQGFFCAVLVN